MPTKPEKKTERRPPKKVPNWHLTSEETMQYINEVESKKLEKKKKEDKYDKVRKEAVAKVKKEERKSTKKVVTGLFKPAPKPKRVKQVK